MVRLNTHSPTGPSRISFDDNASLEMHPQVFRDPVSTADGENMICATPEVPFVLEWVSHVTITASSTLTFNLRIQNRDAALGAGTQVFTADKTANTTLSTERTFAARYVAAQQMVVVEVESIGGTEPSELRIFLGIRRM